MTKRLMILILGALIAAIAAPATSRAERLITSLSSHRVMITSSFSGDNVILFGSIERDAATVPRRGGYDIVVTVTGPAQTLVTRRKDRVLGLWVNFDSRVFVQVPSYLAVLANRPIEAIADADAQRSLQLGLANRVLPQQIGPDVADVTRSDPFRMAFIRLRKEHHLYVEAPNGITLLTPTFYRASIPLPADAAVGNYEIDVKLFADGAMIARSTSALEVVKVGFERFVAAAARDHGFSYGLTAVAMALVTGWMAAVIFRRD
ncbi:MAG: TIGR02186 family protein [Proteobacteria bacterium]|nr:TIGR02186 family protein [Pseudomonadota bacterium]